MKKVRKVLLILVILRVLADVIGFFLPNIVSIIRELGWDVNTFWVDTVHPVVLAMIFLCWYAWYKPVGVPFLITMLVIPMGWTWTLFTTPTATEWLLWDGVTWALVGTFSLAITLIDVHLGKEDH